MAEFLVVRLSGADTQSISWVVVDETGESLALPETGVLSDAVARAQQRKVVVLVPAELVLRTTVRLPVKGQARILQALPYALEEQIASDVSDMHFALGKRGPDDEFSVAAVDRELIQGWIESLREAGLRPWGMYAEVAGLPEHAGYCLLMDGDRCYIRDPLRNYLCGDNDEVMSLLQVMAAGPESTETDHAAYLSEDVVGINTFASDLRIQLPDIQVNTLPQGVLPLLAANVITRPGINLLQGEFADTGHTAKHWSAWRRVAGLAAALAVVALGSKTVELVSLRGEMANLNEQLTAVATETLPPNSRIVNPTAQLEQLASQLTAGTANRDSVFVTMLQSLAGALGDANITAIGKLDYRNGTMDLTLTAPDVETLDRIRAGVEGSGLSAQIQSTSVIDVGVQGRLRISGSRS